jgi:hypothetical protein
MVTVCAWCQKYMGSMEPLNADVVERRETDRRRAPSLYLV